MKRFLHLAVATAFAVLVSGANGMEFQYKGDAEKLRQHAAYCAGEAGKIIGAGLVTAGHTNALFAGLMLEKLRPDGDYTGVKINDTDINEITALSDFLSSKPFNHLESSGHRMLGATLASFKVRAVQKRAKELFGNDGPENWRIPKEKEDPKRFYSLEP
jgi:hypothetical protein